MRVENLIAGDEFPIWNPHQSASGIPDRFGIARHCHLPLGNQGAFGGGPQ